MFLALQVRTQEEARMTVMVHPHRGALRAHGSHREAGRTKHPPLVASKCLSQDPERQEATVCDRNCKQIRQGGASLKFRSIHWMAHVSQSVCWGFWPKS